MNCSTRTIRNARANYRVFGSVTAPNNVRGGRHSAIPPHVLAALLDYLLSKPDLYLDEMVEFVWDQYEVAVSTAVVQRALKTYNWTKTSAGWLNWSQNSWAGRSDWRAWANGGIAIVCSAKMRDRHNMIDNLW